MSWCYRGRLGFCAALGSTGFCWWHLGQEELPGAAVGEEGSGWGTLALHLSGDRTLQTGEGGRGFPGCAACLSLAFAGVPWSPGVCVSVRKENFGFVEQEAAWPGSCDEIPSCWCLVLSGCVQVGEEAEGPPGGEDTCGTGPSGQALVLLGLACGWWQNPFPPGGQSLRAAFFCSGPTHAELVL